MRQSRRIKNNGGDEMKITNKQLNGYHRANSNSFGIGFNDNYNMLHYGITRETSSIIRKALVSLTGSDRTKLPLSDINREIEGLQY